MLKWLNWTLSGGLVTKSCPTLLTPWTVARQTSLSMDSPEKNIGVGCHFLLQGVFSTQDSNLGLLHCRQILYWWTMKRKGKWSLSVVSNSLWPHGHSLPGSPVHGIFQARVLEWVAISFSRWSSQPGDWTRVSHIEGRRFTVWATRWNPYIYGDIYLF